MDCRGESFAEASGAGIAFPSLLYLPHLRHIRPFLPDSIFEV